MRLNRVLFGLLPLIVTACAAPAYTPGLRTPLGAENGVEHREGRIPGTNHLQLLEQSWRPASGTPRAVVVIVHGLKDHSSRYATFASRLAREGFAVRAFDLRGHGDSEGNRVWISSFDEYLTDLGLFLGRVQSEFPDRPVFVFGHSMGGAIVTLYALREKPPVAGLILSGPALKRGANVSGLLAGTAKLLGTIAPRLAVLDLKDEDFTRDPAGVAALKADPLVYHGSGPARTGKELLGAIEEIQGSMESLEIPFIALHGTEDKLTNPEGSRELHARARSQDKTLKLYPGLFHDLLHEPEHEQVEAEIVRWLNARVKK